MQKTLKYKICFNVTIAMVLLYVITVLTLTELYARHVSQKMKSDFIFTGEKILKSINYADGQTESSDSAAHKMHSAYLNIIKAYDDRREYDKIKNPEPYYLKYTTAILLDKDGNVISRTGTALDFSIETHGNTENIVLPLDILVALNDLYKWGRVRFGCWLNRISTTSCDRKTVFGIHNSVYCNRGYRNNDCARLFKNR